jgi:hypothetical protein
MDDAELEEYLMPVNAGVIENVKKARPTWHWTAPYVTHHRYHIRWDYGLDFNQVNTQIMPHMWHEQRNNIYMVMPFFE